MSYISAIKAGDDVLVWERHDKGRELKTFRAPYYFYTKDPNGQHTSMYGDKLSKHEFDTGAEFRRAKADCESSNIEMFESDIAPELKILSDLYYNVPAPKLNITFLDIEVDYSKDIGFSSVENPYAPINSVAVYHTHLEKYVVLAVPPNLAPMNPTGDDYQPGAAGAEFIDTLKSIAPLPDNITIEVVLCSNETELLLTLMTEIEDSDVLCGWNSDVFDIPYIGKRLEKLGRKYLQMLSFPEANTPSWRTVEMYGKEVTLLDISGRLSADYMVLFQKYEMEERPSYKLESIANEMLPHLPKLEYEGSLAELYRNDFAWFVRYNIRDTEILLGLEDRLGYVDLANQMMHLSTGVWKHVTGTLKLAEHAVINYCHHELGGLIVNDFHSNSEQTSGIQGAFVLIPQHGVHANIGSIDINSLYPSSIRSINISPETLLGQFELKSRATEEIAKGSYVKLTCTFDDATHVPEKIRGATITATADEWREQFKSMKWAVSGYGTVFTQEKQGIIPKILEDWYASRKKYQKLKNEAKAVGDKIKATYYDKLQYTYKIKLNSFYGATTNQYFKFGDQRMGESTTGTGRMILIHQCAEVCNVLDGVYTGPDKSETDKDGKEHVGYSDKWSVVYGDTDSSYFLTHAEDPDTAVIIADRVGELVNKSFPDFMRKTFLCTPGYDTLIQCGREVVSDKGIFVDKKRYVLHIIDNEGDRVDKMKVMGLDTKKTTLPMQTRLILNKFIERYLKGEDWESICEDIVEYKNYIETTNNVLEIGLPKGVKNVEQYAREYKLDSTTRLPGHVAAALFYNQCLDEFGDKQSLLITSGMKIKVFYLSKKYGRFKSIAIPVDIEQVPDWFTENFKIDRKAHIERLVDNPLNNIIKVTHLEVPSKQSLLNDTLLGF